MHKRLHTKTAHSGQKKRKCSETSSRSRGLNQLCRYSAVKLVLLSIIIALAMSLPSHRVKKVPPSNALERPITETSSDKSLEPAKLSVDRPPLSRVNENGTMSENAPPCGAKQRYSEVVCEGVNPSKTPPSKIS